MKNSFRQGSCFSLEVALLVFLFIIKYTINREQYSESEWRYLWAEILQSEYRILEI